MLQVACSLFYDFIEALHEHCLHACLRLAQAQVVFMAVDEIKLSTEVKHA